MNKQKIEDFMKDPIVQEALREDGVEEVARLASMAGVLEKDGDLLRLSEWLQDKGKKS